VNHDNQGIDVNWTITVINKHPLPPTPLLTPCITPPVHHHGSGQTWQTDTNFRQ